MATPASSMRSFYVTAISRGSTDAAVCAGRDGRRPEASSALYLKQLQALVCFLCGLSIRELVFDLLIKLSRLRWIRTAVVIRQRQQDDGLWHEERRLIGKLLIKLRGLRTFSSFII